MGINNTRSKEFMQMIKIQCMDRDLNPQEKHSRIEVKQT